MLKLKNNVITYALILAAIVVGLDQITKHWVSLNFPYDSQYVVFPGFALTLRHNTGAGFSFLADASGWQRWFFVSLAFIMSIFIVVWLNQLKPQQKLEALGLSLILGGAIGNLIDRLMFGYVVDFILLYYKEWQWPAFNLADTAICVGVVLLIAGMFKITPSS